MGSKSLHIFFDAEGTLYVPKKDHDYMDFWDGEPTLDRAKKIFELADGVHDMLTELKKKKFPLHIVSHHNEELLNDMLDYFDIKDYFEEIMVNGNKGERIKEIAEKKNVSMNSCLMVGDLYDHDIEPVTKLGGNAVLIDRDHNTDFKGPRIGNFEEFRNLIIHDQFN